MMNRTFQIISIKFPQFETSDWMEWFDLKLIPVLPSFTAEMLQISITNINCTDYQVIVEGLSNISVKMAENKKQDLVDVLFAYLKKSLQQSYQPACRVKNQTESDWLTVNFGKFSNYLSYSELTEFKISGVAVLNLLTGEQKAELILQSGSGLMGNESVVREVFNSVLMSSDQNQLDIFFTTFNQIAGQINMTSVPPVVSETILNMTLESLLTRFQTFSPQNFTLWFQTYLRLFLPGIGPKTLSVIPRNISCDSYREIVKGFDNVYSDLSALQSKTVFSYTKDYLVYQSSQGQSCVQSVSSDSDWLEKNFGRFRSFGSVSDFVSLKKDFNGVAVLNLLSGEQKAELILQSGSGLMGNVSVVREVFNSVLVSSDQKQLDIFFTTFIQKGEEVALLNILTGEQKAQLILQSGSGLMGNESVVRKVFNSVLMTSGQNHLDIFFTTFNQTAGQINVTSIPPVVSETILNMTLEALVYRFQTFSPQNFTLWFQTYLRLFLAGIGPKTLSVIPRNISCDSYREIVKGFDNVYSDLSALQSKTVFSYTKDYLVYQSSQGQSCVQSVSSDSDWLVKNFGRFWMFGSISDFISLKKDFNGVKVLYSLTGEQKAELILQSGSGLMGNESVVREVFNSVLMSSDQNQLDIFFTTFNQNAGQINMTSVPPVVSETILNMTLESLLTRFQTFSPQDFTLWFQLYLPLFLPGIGPKTLSVIPRNISCDSYREIVKGFDNVYSDLSALQSKTVFSYTKDYLVYQSSQGQSCVQSVSSDSDWLVKNFGRFWMFGSISDFISLKKDFNGVKVLYSLTGEQKAELILQSGSGLMGNESVVREVFNSVLMSSDQSQLDIFFTTFNQIAGQINMTSVPPVVSETILNMTLESLLTRFQTFSPQDFTLWFQLYLPLFLPGIGPNTLSVIPRNISCDSYREIVKGFDDVYSDLSALQSKTVFSYTKDYLVYQSSQGQSCVQSVSSDSDWLVKNFGRFWMFGSISDFISLKKDFNGVKVLYSLTGEQKAELILQSGSGLMGNESVLREVFNSVLMSSDQSQLDIFFTTFNQIAGQINMTSLPPVVSEIILNMTLEVLVSRFQTFSPQDFTLWFQTYLRLFLPKIGPKTLSVIPRNISCDSYREILKGFNNVYTGLSILQSGQIFNFVQDYLLYKFSQEPNGLSCYSGGSFFVFLKSFFLSFGFPDLSGVLSIIPANRQKELLDSISPGELSQFLNGTNTVGNGSDLCTFLNNYNRTNQYLEKEPVVSAAVGRQTLACVWSRALSASSQDEVDQWFNVRLGRYLPFLSSQLINSTQLSNASCLSYRKLVSVLGSNYNFSGTDFTPADVYSSIKSYLNSSDGSPRCYNSSDPLLNSTAWFSNNIGFFITFITLTDLQSFVSDSKIGVFLENPQNLQLFNNTAISADVTKYYSSQLFIQNPALNPLSLPGVLLCGAPGPVFVSRGAESFKTILDSINTFCSAVDLEVSAALVTNFPTISTSTIQTLGNQSVGLTQGQISILTPTVINSTLPTLSTVTGWNQGQANALIKSITSAGFTINSASSLVSLGTLVGGVPSATIKNIPSTQVLTASQNPTFITNILSAPVILQRSVVQKIVFVDKTKVVQNVPDALAAYVPRVLLTNLKSVDVTLINKKSWSQQQATVLFGAVSKSTIDTEVLSESLLQGFTSSSIKTLSQQKIRQLVTACRPRPGRNKVVLKESQLSCMYNAMKYDTTLSFTDVPSDMLLYYSYSRVKTVNCRSYFSALGAADFSVLSSVLSKQTLFKNAQSCLGISGFKLSKDQVGVLGNMICTLNPSYIQNSDPLILENLKNCGDLSDTQVTAIQTLLFSGNTQYGNPSAWNLRTLQQLGTLPLYFKQDFWGKFSFTVRKMYFKSFMTFLRKRKTPKWKLRRLFKASTVSRFRRSADCTVGNITAVTIADESFPIDYDSTQFDLCLDVTVLNDNLAAITEKVVDESFQMIILDKLNQLYPSGLPESVVQLLGSTSRVANVSDISKWNITTIDTLSSLMNSDNGDWTSDQSKAVIMKYLSVEGNTLGTDELNAIGSNLCSLDVSVLKTITADSLGNTNTLDISSCSIDQKSALYSIANSSFSSERSDPTTFFLLISPYLGGAPVEDIRALSTQNISMDISTFLSLNPAVIMDLSVSTVQDLMGVNIADLKTFEESSVIQAWVTQQKQSELNTLNIDLQGGIDDINTSTSAPVTITSITDSETTTISTETTTTAAETTTSAAETTTTAAETTTTAAETTTTTAETTTTAAETTTTTAETTTISIKTTTTVDAETTTTAATNTSTITTDTSTTASHTATTGIHTTTTASHTATTGIDTTTTASHTATTTTDSSSTVSHTATTATDTSIDASNTATTGIDTTTIASHTATTGIDTSNTASPTATTGIGTTTTASHTATMGIDTSITASHTVTIGIDTSTTASHIATTGIDTTTTASHTATTGIDTSTTASHIATTGIDTTTTASHTATTDIGTTTTATTGTDTTTTATTGIGTTTTTTTGTDTTTTATTGIGTTITASHTATTGINTSTTASHTATTTTDSSSTVSHTATTATDTSIDASNTATTGIDTTTIASHTATTGIDTSNTASPTATTGIGTTTTASHTATTGIDTTTTASHTATTTTDSSSTVSHTATTATDTSIDASNTATTGIDTTTIASHTATTGIDTSNTASPTATTGIGTTTTASHTATMGIDTSITASHTVTIGIDTSTTASHIATTGIDTTTTASHTATTGIDTSTTASHIATTGIDTTTTASHTATTDIGTTTTATTGTDTTTTATTGIGTTTTTTTGTDTTTTATTGIGTTITASHTATTGINTSTTASHTATTTTDSSSTVSHTATTATDTSIDASNTATTGIDTTTIASHTATTGIDTSNTASPTATTGIGTTTTASHTATTGIDTTTTASHTATTTTDSSSTVSHTATTATDTSIDASNTATTGIDTTTIASHTATTGIDTSNTASPTATTGIGTTTTASHTATMGIDTSITASHTVTIGIDTSTTASHIATTGIDTTTTASHTATTGIDTSTTASHIATTGIDTTTTASHTATTDIGTTTTATTGTDTTTTATTGIGTTTTTTTGTDTTTTATTGIGTTITASHTATTGINTSTTASHTATTGVDTTTTASHTATTGIDTATITSHTATTGINTSTTASHNATTGINTSTTATNTSTTGIVTTTTPSNTATTGIGTSTTASHTATTDINISTTVSNTASTGIGTTTTASHTATTGIETSTTGSLTATIGIGTTSTATNIATTGIATTTAIHTATTGIETSTTGSLTATIGIGTISTATNIATTGIGTTTIATNTATTGIGTTTTASNTATTGIATTTASHTATTGIETSTTGSLTPTIGIGTISTATNIATTGIGTTTIATNTATTGIGTTTTASNTATTGIGTSTTASNTASTDIGTSTTASNTATTAINTSTTASHTATTGIGTSTTPSNTATTGIGTTTTATNTATTGIGTTTTATNTATTGIGTNTTASNTASTGIATITTASNTATTGINTSTTASHTATTGIGTTTTTIHTATTGIGTTTTASNIATTGIGTTTTATNTATTGIGTTTTASNTATTGIGTTTTTIHTATTGIGTTTTASNIATTGIGTTTTATNTASTGIGTTTTASNTATTGIGTTTTASNIATTGIGTTTTTIHTATTGIGTTTTTTHTATTGINTSTTASNTATTGIGTSTTASHTTPIVIDTVTSATHNTTIFAPTATAKTTVNNILNSNTTTIDNYTTITSTVPNTVTSATFTTANPLVPTTTGITSSAIVNIVTSAPRSCQGVDSRPLETQLQSGNISAVLCSFPISDYACSSAAVLSSKDLTTLLTCKLTSNVSYSTEIWTLFFQRFSAQLEDVLDAYSNIALNTSLPDTNVLDAISEVKVKNFSQTQLTDVAFISKWFQIRLRPFFLTASSAFLSSLSSKNFSCQTYQVVVDILSSEGPLMETRQKLSIFAYFIIPFLSGQSCVQSVSSDSDWLVKNFGQFRSFASLSDFINLKSDFNGVNAAAVLSPSQLAGLCSEPSRLRGPQDVNTVMAAINPNQFASFFNILTPNILLNESRYSIDVKEAFLQNVLQRGGLSSAAVPDAEVLQWVNVLLTPFLSSLSSADVTPYFNIIRNRSCNTSQTAVSKLDSLRSSFNNDTQVQIFKNIQQLLAEPNGLSCYSGGSFFVFLKSFFLSFGFPDLSGVLSIIPANRQKELLDSISPGELSQFLNGTNTVGNGSDLCTFLNNYNRTNQYLEKEPVVSAAVGRQTLACVWSRALSASSQDEVDQWFNVRLGRYLPFLSSQLINSTQLSGASCLSYRKLVSVLGNNYNFSGTDFTPADVYSSIKSYLKSSDGSPRCYNSSDPLLNSTAWFSNNIGFFITFITLTDLQSFVSDSKIGVFLENPQNLQLFNNTAISADVTKYYSSQLFIQNPALNPLSLPGVLLCGVPGSAFVTLGASESQNIIASINKFCPQISPEVTAALVANIPTLTVSSVQTLGNQSVGLTEGQITAATPSIINTTLPTLSIVPGWNQGQANALIQSITSAGFTINTGSSLVTLGTLIGGVPAATISSIPPTQLLTVSQNPTFITNILTAPVIVQKTYVQQIVSVDQTKVVENVPDALASYIPPVLLSSPTSVNVTLINKKSWKQEQALVLFGPVASASVDTEELSESVLQGFTCSSVQTLSQQKIRQLVTACRPRAGRNKVVLKESQLSCMYNFVKDDLTLNFTDVHSDVLLYYSYDKVPKEKCTSYFSALSAADFSIPSSVLNLPSTLFKSAQDCLGISGGRLSKDQVGVLGNMICTLNPSYIQNSDPLILENLKNCGDLSDAQVTAIQTLLFSGNTPYGNRSTWSLDTLGKLGILPLYLKRDFWASFSSTTKTTFLKSFIANLRTRKIGMLKLKKFFTEYNYNFKVTGRAQAVCTTGNITEATIADPSFPFGYDYTQFDACLDITVLKDNIAAITDKVVDTSFQTIILNKLNQLFPSGLPNSVVQLLGSTSRLATASDISKWNITTIDALSSLMNPINGDWTSDQSKAVIMKYLSMEGNTLGTVELNAIGSNLCSLDVSVLNTISANSLKKADFLNISSCSLYQKSALYSIANSSFSSQRNDPTTFYQLISSYLGGAPVNDIQVLSTQNISMDISTFRSLNPAALTALSVGTVRDLLGVNLPDLKLFENSTEVQFWVDQQYKVDLETLNIGLIGGKDLVTSTTTTTTNTTTVTTTSHITFNATAQGSAVVHRGSGPWFITLCVALLTITLQILP
ncbi:serine-rich adhesin for platelets isoform X10 [Astyanax mexicanus]|uniref:serine-rich adhesin for platelets isoform X9 n=1 Tax=Astyanax mexicanus TaxID=7994 RepID=UPI0020CAACDA|nr:serine-rich adhesin for platelets isoform X9 [Astyanax mexicanus]XP_049325840.1 serine-rich adhesin for platelets isoform X10 [Astyanax mexicanus]